MNNDQLEILLQTRKWIQDKEDLNETIRRLISTDGKWSIWYQKKRFSEIAEVWHREPYVRMFRCKQGFFELNQAMLNIKYVIRRVDSIVSWNSEQEILKKEIIL